MRYETCMKNIDSNDEVWRNKIGHELKKEVFCSQNCTIEFIKEDKYG